MPIEDNLLTLNNLRALEVILDGEMEELRQLREIVDFSVLTRKISVEQLQEEYFPVIKRTIDNLLVVDDLPEVRFRTKLSQKNRLNVAYRYFAVGAIAVGGSSVIPESFELLKGVGFGIGLTGICRYFTRVPKIGSYLPDLKTIVLSDGQPFPIAIAVAAHEYVHHVQMGKKKPFRLGHKYLIEIEGQANSVMNIATGIMARELKSPEIKFGGIMTSYPMLKNVYSWMCKRLSVDKRNDLLGVHGWGVAEDTNQIKSPKANFVGYTFFRLSENEFGPAFIKDYFHMPKNERWSMLTS